MVIPLSVPHIKGNELKYVSECLATGWVSSAGSYVNRFEKDICDYTKAGYAIACVNGTSALHVALMLSGVEAGDEVLIPTLTFIAPVNVIHYIGAKPVFMDCDDYLNIDPEKLSDFIKNECTFSNNALKNKKSGAQVRAIVPVHIFGHPANLEPIMQLAEKYNLQVIEDATESLGSCYVDGAYKQKKTGTIGHIGCYSFNGNKIITTGGGGMIVTDDKVKAEKARYLTTQAKDNENLFIHDNIGYNYRLTNIQAAIGCAQLESLDEFIEIKRKNYLQYKELFKSISSVSLLNEPFYSKSNYWYYALLFNFAESKLTNLDICIQLREKGIESRLFWYLNHLQKPYRDCEAYKIEKAFKFYDRGLSIPCSVALSEEEITRVAEAIKDIYER